MDRERVTVGQRGVGISKGQKLEGNVGESGKLIKGRRVKNERVRAENRWMMQHNKRVATLNFTFQLLDIYR